MAYVSTASGSLGGTAGGAGLVQKAYDRLLEFALRSEPLIRSVADKRPANQSVPGSTVVLQRYVDLSAATTALTEDTDPDAVAMSTPTSVTITLAEYGNSVLVTRALELFSLADVDPAIANIIAFNLADSIDSVAMTTLRGGSNIIYSGSTATSTATITAAATISSANVRRAVAKLRANKATGRKGSLSGLVSTQKFHTTSALKQVQQDGFFQISTVHHRTASGQEKSAHTKVHTSLSQHVCTTLQTVHHLHVTTAQLSADSKH
jgi:hypothetical protein